MTQKTSTTRLFYRLCCFVLFFVAAAASFSGYYEKWHFSEAGICGEDSRFPFESMVDGTAYRPVIYRQMLPAIANWIDRITPVAIKNRIYRYQNGPGAGMDQLFDSDTGENPTYFFRYLIVYASTFLFALLAVYAMHLVCRSAGIRMPGSVFAPVLVILLIPYMESNGGYFYDYPELAFLALAVWVATRFNGWWLLPVAALGAWNKETFLFLVPTLYPFLRQRCSRRGAWVQMVALCLTCLAVFLPIYMRFRNNPADASQTPGLEQLRFFLHPQNLLFAVEKTYGVLMLKAFTIAPLALLVWAVWRSWPHLPRQVQRHGQIAAAINLPLFFLFCAPTEIRNLSMLYVVFLLVLAWNLNEWLSSSTPAKKI